MRCEVPKPARVAREYTPVISLPNGWRLCNGQYGTFDLRDKFVKGAILFVVSLIYSLPALLLVCPTVFLPFTRGELLLGTWQNVFFCEFDGPRSTRRVIVSVSS